MGYCLIFPGQGTQFPGMSRGLEITGAIPGTLRRLMEEGPAEELDLTLNAQPAVLSVSAALWKRSGLTDPLCVMGHSLGEYTALVAAGSLDLDEAVALVTKRAVLMEASSPRKGSMAAVVGLSAGEVAKVCALFEDLWVANLNGASQVVISGRAESVDAAVPALKERGARKVVPLKVSVASHCPYMEQASAKLAEHLGSVGLGRPSCPVISNVTAGPETDPGRIKDLLGRQLVSPVRFEESVKAACGLGVDLFVEIGPRPVLGALVRRIAPGVEVREITA